MNWLKKIFSSQSSQDTKVYYEVEKDKKEEEKQQLTKSEIENLQIDNSHSSWWRPCSGLSQKFSNSPKGEKRNWGGLSCEEEEENWWSSFKSSQWSTQKSSQESSSSQKESDKNEDNDKQEGATGGDEDDDDDIKVEFYVKCGKNKKFKYYWSFFIFSDIDNVNKSKIHSYFYQYGIKETKENFEKLANVINKNKYLIHEQIFKLIENCQIINNNNYGLIMEIDSEENKHLLDYLTKIFFTRKLGQRRAEKKKKKNLDTDMKLELCLLKFWFIKYRSWKSKELENSNIKQQNIYFIIFLIYVIISLIIHGIIAPEENFMVVH